MKIIPITNDIIPIADFKTSNSQWFKGFWNTGHTVVIPPNGKPAVVLLSPSDYDDWYNDNSFSILPTEGLRMPMA